MKKMNSIPLICGFLSITAFLIYFYSANHAPYSYTDIILLGPVFSFVGLIFSIINLSFLLLLEKKEHLFGG